MFVKVLIILVTLAGTSTASTKTITVPGLGQFRGNIRSGCNEYLGIKFATCQRFEDPEDIIPWPPTYDATFRRPMCYQTCPDFPEQVCQPEGISEDCLFLNIFTPTGDPTGRCVMVFYHGGNYRSYSGGSLLYDGEAFVQTGGCILVTVNYRLSVFGFLGKRNTGLRDQIKALEWVYTNIEGFGGDKTKITLFGQSAGAQSIALMMSIPAASQYFNKVILQSCPFTLPFRSKELGDFQEAHIANRMNCPVNDLPCYQNVDPDDILRWQDDPEITPPGSDFLLALEKWGPVIDGELVLANLYDIFVDQTYTPKDAIIGTVADEGLGYILNIFSSPLPEAGLNALLQTIDSSLNSGALFPFYVVTDPLDTRDVLADFTTDYIFNCVSQDVGNMMRARGKRIYFYIFDEVFPAPVWGPEDPCNDGVCHGIELVSAFGTYPLGGYTLSPAQEKLSQDIIKYWTNFAKNGSPNRFFSGLRHWQTSKILHQFGFTGQLLLRASQSTRMTKIRERIKNYLKCSQLKQLLGFLPF